MRLTFALIVYQIIIVFSLNQNTISQFVTIVSQIWSLCELRTSNI